MTALPRILEIKNVEPYKVSVLFSTNEIREIDFEGWLHLTDKNSGVFNKLSNESIFRQVKLDPVSHTLYWDGLTRMVDLDGSEKPAPLDFCPDVLYEISKPVSSEKTYH